MSQSKSVTQLLIDWKSGDKSALDTLMPIVYDELRRIASRYLRKHPPGHILQTTLLVHEAYLKLADNENINWQNRAHFFGVAARIMRNLLVNYSVANKAEKRGGGSIKISLDEATILAKTPAFEVLELNEALNRLSAMNERQSQIVELRFFTGLSNEEIGEVLGVSLATVNREWRLSRAWLHSELRGDVGG